MEAEVGMLIVETIAKIRRAFFVQGKSIKAICRELRVSRKVVRKVIRSEATEFRYEREAQPLPKIGPWRDKLDQLLLANEGKTSRERLTLIRLYGRFDGAETARVMARLYAAARLYVNFFQPSFKLKEKRREGAKLIKRYDDPPTPYERALAHPMVAEAVKERLRAQYRTLDPVVLLAEIRAAQEELGNRIDRRAGGVLREAVAVKSDVVVRSSTEPTAFARRLGNDLARGEPRATHRRPKRRYKKRIQMPSKLDPYVALIESWLAAEPQLTAIAIVDRLANVHPDQFGKKQHSIVQRLLRALRRSTAQKLIAEAAGDGYEAVVRPPGAVDGSGYAGPDPPTVPLTVPALKVDPSADVLQRPAW
jgi:hypothetical protein